VVTRAGLRDPAPDAIRGEQMRPLIEHQRLRIAGRSIEVAWHGPDAEESASLVLLHEGLGCVATWKEFPRRLAERTGYGVLSYSRAGYGTSDPVTLPRPTNYMHEEANEVLPALLHAVGVRQAILIGHSDGASIATLYAGSRQDRRVRGLVLIAPHFFVEDVGLRSIAAAKIAYERRALRERLAKYHGANVDVAFWGWNRVWLDPAFRSWRIDDCLAFIRVPILILQGTQDEYGTIAQIETAERETYCPLEVVMLEGAGHAPQTDRPETTLEAIADFVRRVLEVHEGLAPVKAGGPLLRPSG
jgi:pimeloyl-ACP methyl ester carboxylesterase